MPQKVAESLKMREATKLSRDQMHSIYENLKNCFGSRFYGATVEEVFIDSNVTFRDVIPTRVNDRFESFREAVVLVNLLDDTQGASLIPLRFHLPKKWQEILDSLPAEKKHILAA